MKQTAHIPELEKLLQDIEPEVIALRQWFHQNPELGFREFKTAEKIEGYLTDLGFAPCRVAGTGVVAVLDSGNPGPVLMLRADMDALPVTEANDLPFASRNKGIMHACGHDAHMAMLLGAAKILAANRTCFNGKIKFVFQPDEEVAGAKKMVADGVLKNPDVDAVTGIHIWSQLPSGQVSITPGVVMAGMDVFKMRVKGRGGHTGYPHQAVDPVLAAAQIIQSVQAVQTREIDARQPTIIMFGQVHAGEKANIIPEEVYMEGSIRFLLPAEPDDPDSPTNRFIRICEGVAKTLQCSITIDIEHENIPLVNDENMVAMAKGCADRIGVVNQSQRYVASEDFSEFSTRVPGVFVFLGCADPDKGTDMPHHNPEFNIDETVLIKGVHLHVLNALTFGSS